MKASKKKGEVLKKQTKPTQVKVNGTEVSQNQHRMWESYRDRMKLANPAAVERGQIWSTLMKPKHLKGIKPTVAGELRLVLVLDSNGEVLAYGGRRYKKILVAPISPDIEMATHWDFIVDEETSPLGYPFMAEVWNKTTILDDSLNSFLGVVNEGLLILIERLNFDYVQNTIENTEVDWEIYGKNIGEREVKPGNEVYHFQRREVDETEYLSLPVRKLTCASSKLQR